MKPIKLREIAYVTGANDDNISEDIYVSKISTDTRSLKKGDLFLALEGEKYSAADFVEVAEKKGACAVISEKNVKASLPILKVESSLEALWKIAEHYRKSLSAKIIAVTGSTGKTTTRNMIFSVLSSKYKVFRSDKNYNNEIGLPKSILELDDSYDVAVLEMGMNHFGEISRLSKIAKPDIAVITNIGKAHIGNLGSLENTLKAKLEILDGLKLGGTLILNSDDKLLRNVKAEGFKTAFVGMEKEFKPDVNALDIERSDNGAEYEVKAGNKDFKVYLSALGKHNVLNSLFAIYIGIEFGVPKEDIIDSLGRYSPSPMRSEISFANGIKIIKDYYNSSPDSAKEAVKNLSLSGGNGKKIAILGEISELGSFSPNEHFELAVSCCKNQIDHVFFIGEDFKSFKSGMKKHSDCFSANERDLLLKKLKNYVISGNLKAGDTVLIKGSRKMKMEKFYEALKRYIKGEDFIPYSPSLARLYVDVNAIKHNYLQVKNALEKDVEIMPMVKANAYGTDSDIVANLFSCCKYLAVADIKEALAIRRLLSDVNIVIIYQPSCEDIPEIVKNGYIPAVSDLKFAKILDAESVLQNKVTRVHVEADTGHGRLGLNLDEVKQFAAEMKKLKNIKVEGMFMHYACADSLEKSDLEFTKLQTERFKKAITDFESVYGAVKYKHACAGAAIFNENAEHFNMVRPGYILYGYYPCEFLKKKVDLKPCLKLAASILQIREVEAGTPISYNRRFVTKRKSRIATIGIGYSDGIFRSLFNAKNPGSFVVNGQKAHIVGTICMDLTMIDITDIKGEVKVGDEVFIFDNDNVTIDEMADICGTIGYEIISRIAEKSDRIEIF